MFKLSDRQSEIAKNIHEELEEVVAQQGHKFLVEFFGASSGAISKFAKSNDPECKIDLKSLSEWMAYSGLRFCPEGYIPVEKNTVQWAWMDIRLSNGAVGHKLSFLRKEFLSWFGENIEALPKK